MAFQSGITTNFTVAIFFVCRAPKLLRRLFVRLRSILGLCAIVAIRLRSILVLCASVAYHFGKRCPGYLQMLVRRQYGFPKRNNGITDNEFYGCHFFRMPSPKVASKTFRSFTFVYGLILVLCATVAYHLVKRCPGYLRC
jgi:hypothetical protein